MRPSRIPIRRVGLTVAAATTLPLTVCATAHASPVLTVTATGSTVHLSTTACAGGGLAKLVATGRANPVQGHPARLMRSAGERTASWDGLEDGLYSVSVLCSDGTSPGSRSVTVGAGGGAGTSAAVALFAAPTGVPTIAATSRPRVTRSPSASPSVPAPARGVQGGVGGSSTDYGGLTFTVGGALISAALAAGAWQLRRRQPGRRS